MQGRDTIGSIENRNIVHGLEAEFEAEKKVAEINRLSIEDELNQTRIGKQRMGLIGAAVALALLSFLLYRLFGQKRKIEAQHTVISTALSEKDTLLREIHHRVKNNLQVISSLLRIQSNETTDAAALDALKEGQSRVQTMSLIHQDLYQRDNLTSINMRDYLDRLTHSLFDTYNISPARIQLQTEIDDLQLDVDTVVPLGLIINELISNALKYAFPEGQSGQLKVSLKMSKHDLVLLVTDDGVGIQQDQKEDSFGYGLIQAFANKLEAEMTIVSGIGTTVKMVVPNFQNK